MYFWVNNEVVVKYWGDDNRVIREVPCLDSDDPEPIGRYGFFNNTDRGGWTHTPVESFPKDFRIHLLLLGVS